MSSIVPTTTEPSQQEPPVPLFVPPLEHGDRLTRAEFERRYEAMPHVKKAELIEGVVHMPSPVRIKQHARPHRDLATFFGIYSHFTPGVGGGDNPTVRLDMDNEPQPDNVLYIEPECGGRVRIDDDDYINGGPELAAEISSSSVSIDLGQKLHVCRRNEIQEYIVWRVLERAIDWFCWKDGSFQWLESTPEGIYKSRTFPGLWIDTTAILNGDFARAHAILQQGLDSPEHADFVARLEAKRQKK